MIPALPDDLADLTLGLLDALDRIKLASICKKTSKLGMSERDYVRSVCRLFQRKVPTFSGKQLSMYRLYGFIDQHGKKEAEFWFR